MEEQEPLRKVRALTHKLSLWYWSPEFPSTYKLNNVGLGKIALSNPAAFNLTWAKHQTQLTTLDEHKEAVTYFSLVGRMLNVRVNDSVLGDYATLYTQVQFSSWYFKHVRKQLPNSHIQVLDQALNEKV